MMKAQAIVTVLLALDLLPEDLYANPVIPIRSGNNDITGGTYRREMAQPSNDVVYP